MKLSSASVEINYLYSLDVLRNVSRSAASKAELMRLVQSRFREHLLNETALVAFIPYPLTLNVLIVFPISLSAE